MNCLRGYLNPLRLFANLNRITDTSSQTCSPFEIQQLLDWLSSYYSLQCLCNCRGGPGQSENGYLSITVPPSHPLSSSERCTLLLIFSTCQKLGEQLLGRTATLLNLDTSQLSISTIFLFSIWINKAMHQAQQLLACCQAAPNSFSPYKVIQSVVGQGKKEMGL